MVKHARVIARLLGQWMLADCHACATVPNLIKCVCKNNMFYQEQLSVSKCVATLTYNQKQWLGDTFNTHCAVFFCIFHIMSSLFQMLKNFCARYKLSVALLSELRQ